MRNPHNPQPALNLGDDPDPAAEIGSRLAAGSQAAQGLLTNYLFYGQRRTAQGDQLQGQTLTHQQTDDGAHQLSDLAHSDDLARKVRSQRTRPDRGDVAADGVQGSGRAAGTDVGAPRLRLIPWRADGGMANTTALWASADQGLKPSSDALAADPLTDDPLAHEQLACPHGPESLILPEPPPARRPC